MQTVVMNDASRYLMAIARRNARAYAALPEAQAIMVAGSVAQGQCDFYSDIDMMVYYDALPAEEALGAAREQNGGTARRWLAGDREAGSVAESYPVRGVECQVVHATIAAWERDMATVLQQLDVTSPLQKALSGLLEGVPLHGEPLIREWQARAADYPAALARAMVEGHLAFFPIWGLEEQLATRDATLWRYEALVEAVQHLLAVLAGLNRLYFSPYQFKRAEAFIAKMDIAPENLAARLEALFRAELRTAGRELEALVRETLDCVEPQMPEVDTSGPRRLLGWRQTPWQPEAGEIGE
jgi:hypothetical protein